MGCALAHALALENINEPTLILEDDAEPLESQELPNTWDLVWLGGNTLLGGPNGTHAYVVNANAASLMRKVFSTAVTSPDFYWSVFEHELEVYYVQMYKQSGSLSDIWA